MTQRPRLHAERDVPRLQDHARQLHALASEATRDVRYRADDDFAFMALSFLSKQLDHLQAILLLGLHRDATLIARSMLEGLSQLLWSTADKAGRARRWRNFAWVHDWRVMQAHVARGDSVDALLQQRIEDALHEQGAQFLTAKARRARDKGKEMPNDPYLINWTGLGVAQLSRETKGEDLYKWIYSTFSDWHHWNTGGLGQAVEHHENQVTYSSPSPTQTATALAVAFQCVMQTLEIVNGHLELGMDLRMQTLLDRFLSAPETGGLM